MTYIHELTRAPVVVHFHPDTNEGGDFSLAQAEQALELGVHAVEADLRIYSRDGRLVCSHDRAGASSPALADLVGLVLARKGGRESVNGDSLQFFLVLEPKERRLDLFEAMYAAIAPHESLLSTAAAPGSGPRPITVVVTGAYRRECHAHLAAIHGEQFDRLFVVEDVDYGGRVIDLSGHATTFQWTTLKYDRHVPRGRINALHTGRDPLCPGIFNVRVWNARSEPALRAALAAGADSINANLSKIERLQSVIASQDPRGSEPALAIAGDDALLCWRGASRTRTLYAAFGKARSARLTFARQLNLTDLLAEMPTGSSPACALLPDGRVLIVYEDSSGGLAYVAGSFTDVERHPSFDGRAAALLRRDEAAVQGGKPSVALLPDGRILVAFARGASAGYYLGSVRRSGEIIGDEVELAGGVDNVPAGVPGTAANGKGIIVLVYNGPGLPLRGFQARIAADGRLTLGRALLRLVAGGRSAAVAVGPTGDVLAAYERPRRNELYYVGLAGDGDGQSGFVERALTEGDARRGTRPSAAFAGDGSVFVSYRGTGESKLWYVGGTLNAAGVFTGAEHRVEIGFSTWRTVDDLL